MPLPTPPSDAVAPARVLVVIGPSASGKSTVVRELHGRGVVEVHPTWTTRPRRPDEVDGSLEHRFVTDAAFDALERSGAFCETVALFGLPFRYGLPALRPSTDGRVDVVMLRAPLVERFRRDLPGAVVYQVEADDRSVRRRLRSRSCPSADVAARTRDNVAEAVLGRTVADRCLVNDDTIDDLADRLEAALVADGLRDPVAPLHPVAPSPASAPPRPPPAWPPPPIPRTRTGPEWWRVLGTALVAVFAVVGMAAVAGVALLWVSVASYGSNK